MRPLALLYNGGPLCGPSPIFSKHPEFGEFTLNRKTERRECLDPRLNGVILEEVNSLKYLGFISGKSEGVVEDMNGKVNEEGKVSGTMNRIWKVRSLGDKFKKNDV